MNLLHSYPGSRFSFDMTKERPNNECKSNHVKNKPCFLLPEIRRSGLSGKESTCGPKRICLIQKRTPPDIILYIYIKSAAVDLLTKISKQGNDRST